MIDPGKLNHRIAHYRQIETKSPLGAPVIEIERVRFAWAKVSGAGSSSSGNGDRDQAVDRFTVILMMRPGKTIAYNDWLQRGTSWLHVIGVDDTDPDKSQLVMQCETNPKEPPPPIKGA